MNEKPKSNSVVTSKWDNDRQTLVLNVVGAGVIEVPVERLSRTVQDTAMVYGLTQRLADKAAIPKTEGKAASAQEKYEAIKRLAEHYLSGTDEWEMSRGPIGPRLDEWVLRAIASLKGESFADSKARAQKTAEGKGVSIVEIVKVWGQIRAVAEKAAELRAEASGVSGEQVAEMERELGELGK